MLNPNLSRLYSNNVNTYKLFHYKQTTTRHDTSRFVTNNAAMQCAKFTIELSKDSMLTLLPFFCNN